MGSQPIDPAYTKYPHLWDLYGEQYPRDGKNYGFNNQLYGGTEVYRYFEQRFPKVPKVAGVVMYNQSASERFGNSIVKGLQREGYKVDPKTVNFALPGYDSVAIDSKNKRVQYVYDTIDRQGNVRLSKALDDNNVNLTAKVLTPQSWEQSIKSDYSASPHCADELWVTSNSRNFEDVSRSTGSALSTADERGRTRRCTITVGVGARGLGGGQWLADAIGSCGAAVTRKCVETFINAGPSHPYDAHGLLTPRDFEERATPKRTVRNCINVARWSNRSNAWMTQVANMNANCFNVPDLPYSAT